MFLIIFKAITPDIIYINFMCSKLFNSWVVQVAYINSYVALPNVGNYHIFLVSIESVLGRRRSFLINRKN